MQTILDDQKKKLVNLAWDIVKHNLNPSDLAIVISHPDYEDKYIVVEGNRRVATLKILESPYLLDEVQVSSSIANALKRASSAFNDQSGLTCYLAPDRDEADIWIERKHSGQMDGVGTVTWSASQKRRFESKRGAPEIEQQAIEFLLERKLIDKDAVSEIATTTFRRILSDPDVRNDIGLDRESGRLYQKYPDAEIAKGLMRIVHDLLGEYVDDKGEVRKLNVDDVRSKADREVYIKKFDSADLPDLDTRFDQKQSLGSIENTSEVQGVGESADDDETTSGGSAPRPAHSRKRLIPHDQKLNIGSQTPRLKTVFSELKRIDIDKFTNAAGVLFRVFIEISCDKYGTDNDLLGSRNNRNSKDLNSNRFGFWERARLDHKITVVARHLAQDGHLNPKELEAVETVASNQDNSFLSVNLLHTYVHSGEYNPSPRELKDFWDNLQSMIVAIWS